MSRGVRRWLVPPVAATVTAVLVAAAPGAWRRLTSPGAPTVPAAELAGERVADTLLLVTAALWGYAVLVLAATALAAALPGTAPLARRIAPPAARALAAAALGLGLGAHPAAAADRDEPAPAGVSVLDGLPLPDRPFGRAGGARPPGGPTESVRVRPGDTLWDLAAARLPAGADPAAIDQAWRAWWAANRNVVGSNPDLLVPGQRLTPPPAGRHDPAAHRTDHERRPR